MTYSLVNMRGPEVRQQFQDGYEVSAESAFRKALVLTYENTSNVGIAELYDGIKSEIGNDLVESDLRRKGVDLKKLNDDLELLKYCGDSVKPPSQSEVGMSRSAKAVVEYAVNLARSRENPIAQRVNARDLLESVAALAHEEAHKLTLDYIRSHPHPDPEKQQELLRRKELRNNLPRQPKPLLLKIDKPLFSEI